jgi:Rrf2 family transcriptional regulator, iron-sulfur cluster assembly transcription factor
LISNAAQYAVRAAAYLGARESDSFVPARRIAEDLGLPATFLAKVLKQLVDADIVSAFRGPTGGVRLAHPAKQITVRALIEAIDGPALFTECVLGLPGCGERRPCPMHEKWGAAREVMVEQFESQTVASLAEGYSQGSLRLKP